MPAGYHHVTSTGTIDPVILPSPSCPTTFSPQNMTPPPPTTAQALSEPILTATAAGRSGGATGVGEAAWGLKSALGTDPQHRTSPPSSSAQAAELEAVIDTTLVSPATGVTRCGIDGGCPVCPSPLSPQQLTV